MFQLTPEQTASLADAEAAADEDLDHTVSRVRAKLAAENRVVVAGWLIDEMEGLGLQTAAAYAAYAVLRLAGQDGAS
jgi:hypothetical protein